MQKAHLRCKKCTFVAKNAPSVQKVHPNNAPLLQKMHLRCKKCTPSLQKLHLPVVGFRASALSLLRLVPPDSMDRQLQPDHDAALTSTTCPIDWLTGWHEDDNSVVGTGIPVDTSDVSIAETHAVSKANISNVGYCAYDIIDDWDCAVVNCGTASELQVLSSSQQSVHANALPIPTLPSSGKGLRVTDPPDSHDRGDSCKTSSHGQIASCDRGNSCKKQTVLGDNGFAFEQQLLSTPQQSVRTNALPEPMQLAFSSSGHGVCGQEESTEPIGSRARMPTPVSTPLPSLPSSGKGLGVRDRRGSYDRGDSCKKRSHGQIAWEHKQTVLRENGFACKQEWLVPAQPVARYRLAD